MQLSSQEVRMVAPRSRIAGEQFAGAKGTAETSNMGISF
jgi:hypothetical protein